MSNTGKKTTFNHKLVKITWWDIKSSEKSWIAEDEIMKEDIAICYDVGWIWKETKISYGYLLPIHLMMWEWM
jgi:hypothetical protein